MDLSDHKKGTLDLMLKSVDISNPVSIASSFGIVHCIEL